MGFTWVDWAMVVVVVGFILNSLDKGFLRSAASFLLVFVSLWMAWNFSDMASVLLEDVIDSPGLRSSIMGVGIFFLGLIAGALVDRLVLRHLVSDQLGIPDRIMGILLGGAKGLFLLMVVLMVIRNTSMVKEQAWSQSVLVPEVLELADWSYESLSRKVKQAVKQNVI